ncbi:hypothetical protein OIB37_14290 [Streptomyces sp. NBC_00820]|uniref:hypothetical protein n=1 Tax=Streptomyces sp. NBC_00820 TaxID=2975842 RepID=UPI002ED17597|nr:hypothetical protein OIB37_14290 [Streptomyces sp. NBC_00820]
MGGVSGAVRRRLSLGAVLLAASAVFALVSPGAAQAATDSSCAGREVRTLPFRTGVVHVYKRAGYVCALTVTKAPGTQRVMSVSVQARGSRPVVDRGRYRYHAGPVTVHAGHRCVRVAGAVGDGKVSSGWFLC